MDNDTQLLFGHDDETTAYVVDDYPYGFRLRCKIRYWIETHPKRGDRFCSQTTNPKVAGEVWNKPKKSTYVEVGVMYLDDEGHVKWTGLHVWPKAEALEVFDRRCRERLNGSQQARLHDLIVMHKLMARREIAREAAEAQATAG